MNRINILNKEGLISDLDRKQPLSHGCGSFMFESCIDLSIGVKVTPYGNSDKYLINDYSQSLASFIGWWVMNVLKDLNGFPGIDTINFELVGFTLV